MASIAYIRVSKDASLLLLGIVEEGESARYTISESAYESIGRPEAHSELDSRAMLVIKYADALYRAEKKALSLLSYADNNERTLRQKLVRSGFSQEVAEEICAKMVALGYINEHRQLERLVLSEANGKLRGPAKILPHLASKGYSLSEVRGVMSELCERGEVDFAANARRLIEKKLPTDYSEDERNQLLFRNGYKI